MILPKQQKRELINGLLPLLLPVKEETQRVRKVSGVRLLLENVLVDQKGQPIVGDKQYVFTETVSIPVNHKRRLLEVIDRAKTAEDMNEDLARYLVKFGESKQAITDSINHHFKNNQ